MYWCVDKKADITRNDEYASILRAIENCKLYSAIVKIFQYYFLNHFNLGNEKIDSLLHIAMNFMRIKDGSTSILHEAAEKSIPSV